MVLGRKLTQEEIDRLVTDVTSDERSYLDPPHTMYLSPLKNIKVSDLTDEEVEEFLKNIAD